MNNLRKISLRQASRKQNWQSGSLLDIGTRKIFNEEHDMFRESCRKFWASIDKSRVSEWEKLRGATPDIWKAWVLTFTLQTFRKSIFSIKLCK